MPEAEIRGILTEFHKVRDNAYHQASEYLKAIETPCLGSMQSMEFEDDWMVLLDGSRVDSYLVRCESHWRYGGHETDSHQIPLSMLWAPEETIAAAKTVLEAARQRDMEREAHEAKVREENRIVSERKEYERLKKKFE